MRRIYILLVFLVCCQLTQAQSYSYTQYIDAAEKAMLNKDYHTALSHFNSALTFGKDDLSIMYKTAEVARNFKAYEMAGAKYNAVLESESNGEYPLASFWLGDVYQRQGEYYKAIQSYQMYLSEHDGDDAFYTDKANKEIASLEWAKGVVSQPDENIIIEHLGLGVNTPYSDFAPVQIDGELVFSSLRFDQKSAVALPSSQYSKVLTVDGDNAVDYDENINSEDVLIAHSAFNLNKSRVYYTQCEYINVNDVRCDIYFRPVLGDGSLGNAVKLPSEINQSGTTSTQPSIGFNESLGKEILYFVSDREGGEGGLDIWASTIDGMEGYGNPTNVSSINTASNDITPFFHNASQNLYFSSEGYQKLGGYDIYRSNLENGSFQNNEHLGYPINSSFDDIYYSLSDDTGVGYMSSNRAGSYYLVEEVYDSTSCGCVSCYDIYEVRLGDIRLDLNALTFDAETQLALTGATVRLIDVATGQEVGLITNLNGNDHSFQLMTGKEYRIEVEREGYLPVDPIYISTMNSFRSETFEKKFYLQKAPSPYDLQVLTFNQMNGLALNGCTVTLINETDGSIQEVVMNNPGSNEYIFQVIKGHSYRLSASKSGFYDSSLSFVANYASDVYRLTKNLYLQSNIPNLYLPLALYFDNDIPDKRSTRTTTTKTYSETYQPYIARKEEFKTRYSETVSGTDQALAQNRVEGFFEDKIRPGRYRNGVRQGYNNLQLFLNTVLNELVQGQNFKLSIRGFASPRAATKYNAALSQRRVESLKNEIRSYAGGALVQYLQNGSLVIEELAYGETTSANDISDKLFDMRNSVFSPEASQERRVEIERIISQ